MSDRELIERAAKAAGMHVISEGDEWPREKVGWFWNGAGHEKGLFDRSSNALIRWNPLMDDGDALRLAVRMNISLTREEWSDGEYVVFHRGRIVEAEATGKDPYAATRRAIVRAAAAIATNTPGKETT